MIERVWSLRLLFTQPFSLFFYRFLWFSALWILLCLLPMQTSCFKVDETLNALFPVRHQMLLQRLHRCFKGTWQDYQGGMEVEGLLSRPPSKVSNLMCLNICWVTAHLQHPIRESLVRLASWDPLNPPSQFLDSETGLTLFTISFPLLPHDRRFAPWRLKNTFLVEGARRELHWMQENGDQVDWSHLQKFLLRACEDNSHHAKWDDTENVTNNDLRTATQGLKFQKAKKVKNKIDVYTC